MTNSCDSELSLLKLEWDLWILFKTIKNNLFFSLRWEGPEEVMEESKHLDPGGSMLKNPPANAGDAGDMGSIPGWGRSPEQRTRQPTPVFLPGESHGQRSLVGCSSLGFQLREPGRGTGHKESHSLGGRSWTSLISLRYGRSSLTSRYLTFYEERKGPHWKQRIEKVRKHSLRRCPWSPESPTQVSTHALSLKV